MRRPAVSLIVLLAILFAGCKSGSNIAGFWDDVDVTVTEDNFSITQDRFAQFAELLVQAPEDEAIEALNPLFDKLLDNEVDYIIYTQWMEYAFLNYASPCRNSGLFEAVVERIEADGILAPEEVERLKGLVAIDKYNRAGEPCTLPDGITPEGNTLYLVLNLDCRTCRQALAALAETHPEAAHVALCFGWSPVPDIPGWQYLKPEGMKDWFDLEAAPFWFLTDKDGRIDIPYSLEFEAPQFATPESL
ncbi:MAG: DUF5106 domain-containing protein [Bacteroidales bacterium]|nr:DUF5106 domain-containing protein [Bacteroidales bacterium]